MSRNRSACAVFVSRAPLGSAFDDVLLLDCPFPQARAEPVPVVAYSGARCENFQVWWSNNQA